MKMEEGNLMSKRKSKAFTFDGDRASKENTIIK